MTCYKKKNSATYQEVSLGGFVTDFYIPTWVMVSRALYHQTITFTGEMVSISDGQYVFKVKKCVRNAFSRFQGSGEPNFKIPLPRYSPSAHLAK